jgi:hypothetical protein
VIIDELIRYELINVLVLIHGKAIEHRDTHGRLQNSSRRMLQGGFQVENTSKSPKGVACRVPYRTNRKVDVPEM